MLAVIVPGLAGAFFFLFWVWAVFDVIAMDSILIRNLPKTTWIFLVMFIPPVGAVAWLALGRPENAGFSAGSARRAPPQRFDYYSSTPRVRGPEDDPTWQTPRAPRSPSAAQPASALPNSETAASESAASESAASESLAARERKLLEREAELAKREAALGDTTDAAEELPGDPSIEQSPAKPSQTEQSEND